MYCIKCGSSIVEGSKFCDKCGAPVVQVSSLPQPPAAQPSPPPQPPTAPAEVQPAADTKRTSGFAIASLVLGIVGVFFVLLSILAIIFGGLAISQIRKNPGIKGNGMAVAGVVLGIIAIVLWIIFIIIIVISLRGVVY